MRTLMGSFVGLCLILTAMAKATPSETTAVSPNDVASGINQFAMSLFKTEANAVNDNLVLSPLSTAINLAMCAFGAGGETKSQLQKALNLSSPDGEALKGYQAIIDDLSSVQGNELLYNKMYIDQKFAIKEDYRKAIGTHFRAAAENINFEESNIAAETINKWILDLTAKRPSHIKEFVSPTDLDNTKLLLVDAMLIKATWQSNFTSTTSKTFHIDENTQKMVDTMYQAGIFKYGDIPGKDGKFIVLPFQANELSMLIMYPNNINGLSQLEETISQLGIENILKAGSQGQIQLYLPKFTQRNRLSLQDNLRNLGITDMFQSNANFNGISDDKLHVNKVLQTAYVRVNEGGVDFDVAEATPVMRPDQVAASVTSTILEINRPFCYVLFKYLKGANNSKIPLLLYSGHVLEPKIM